MKKSFAGNILLLAVSVLVCIALLEVLLRIYDPCGFRLRGNTIILPVHKRYSFNNSSCGKLDATIVHTKNSHGFRGPEIPPGFEDMLSFFAVGGSTTECLLLSDGHDWPYLTGEKLKPLFPRLWINNAGLDGHSTYGHYLLMENCIAGLKPKIALFLVGTNDTEPYSAYFHDQALLKKNTFEVIAACMGAMARSAAHGEFRQALQGLNLLAAHSAGKSQVASLLLNLHRARKAGQQGLQHRCIDFSALPGKTVPDDEQDRTIHNVNDRVVPVFRTRLLRLMNLTKKAGIYPVLITQPALNGSGIDPDTGVDMNSIECNGRNGMLQWKILEMLNDVTRDVAGKENIALIDLAHAMPRRSAYFYDFIHFTNRGSDVVADIIAAQLIPYLKNEFPGYALPRGSAEPGSDAPPPE